MFINAGKCDLTAVNMKFWQEEESGLKKKKKKRVKKDIELSQYLQANFAQPVL